METITLLILIVICCILISSSGMLGYLVISTPASSIPVTPVPASTPAPIPASTSAPVPASTPVTASTSAPIPASIPAPVPASTPAPASTPVPVQASTPVPVSTPTPVPASILVPASTSASVPASTPVPASTSAPIPASTPAPAPAPGTDCNQIPLYRLYNGSISDHMDSLSNNEASPYYTLDGQIATICSNQAQGTTGLYRGYKNNGQHMSTTTLSELTNNGFTVDFNSQPMGYVYTNSISPNAKPIYRLYNSSNSDHMTSPNLNEAAPSYYADWNGSPMFYSLK